MTGSDFLVLNTLDGYEALYVNGVLFEEGNPIGEGDRFGLAKVIIAEGGTLDQVRFEEMNDIDNEECESFGFFRQQLKDFKGNYKKK